DQLFVRRDEASPFAKRVPGDFTRCLSSANRFDYNVSIVREEIISVAGEDRSRKRETSVTLSVAHQHSGELEANSISGFDCICRFVQQPHERAADNTTSCKSNTYCRR